MTFAIRYDAGAMGRIERTPQGGLRVAARLTRVGVLEYRQPDGTVRRELRPPEEVFKTDSLASLRGAPITDQHPGLVTARNFRAFARGHIADDVRPEGDFVSATVFVQDADMVAMIERGERREVSAAYETEVDETPGTWRGQRYDAVQRRIRYNAAGLGPRGWGRAGAEVALRLDGAGNEIIQRQGSMDYRYDANFGARARQAKAEYLARQNTASPLAPATRADGSRSIAPAATPRFGDRARAAKAEYLHGLRNQWRADGGETERLQLLEALPIGERVKAVTANLKTAVSTESALNGAQVSSLQEIVRAVAAGEIPRASGVQMIAKAFGVTELEADQLLGPAGLTFKPETEGSGAPRADGRNPYASMIATVQRHVDGGRVRTASVGRADARSSAPSSAAPSFGDRARAAKAGYRERMQNAWRSDGKG